MLRSVLAKAPAVARGGPQRLMLGHQPCRGKLSEDKGTQKFMGISLVKQVDKEEETSLFPLLEQMGTTTRERVHSFSVPAHRVIKFIKMGAINKQISVQYCHYLASVAREPGHSREDKDYYAKHCGDLMAYILRTDKNLPSLTRAALLCDTAATSRDNCLAVCDILFKGSGAGSGNDDPHAGKLISMNPKQYADILGACLKFGLWSEAQRLLHRAGPSLLTFRACEPFVEGLVGAAERFKSLSPEDADCQKLRVDVIETIYLFCELSMQYRVQFITKRRRDLLRALEDLQIGIRGNPVIKQSGRCTSCQNHLQLFDHRTVRHLNEAIKSQMLQGSDKGLFLNTSPNDSNRFEQFLHKIHEQDKRPLDCVIDGLNIAYRGSIGYMHFKQNLTKDVSRTVKVPRVESQTQTLINTIIRGNMLQTFRKILVVGKAHMLKWPGLMEFFQRNNIHFYSSFNNTKDDLFQLYASTLSPKTLFVTNDFLRDHLAKLEPSTRVLMERWIDTHQVWICQRTLRPIMPTPYEKIPTADREAGCFHLPVIDFDQLEHVGVSDPPPHLNSKALAWLCCTTKASVTTAAAAAETRQTIAQTTDRVAGFE